MELYPGAHRISSLHKGFRSLSHARAGLTLSELMDAAMEEFPAWPASTREWPSLPVRGHLDQLGPTAKSLGSPIYSPRWKIERFAAPVWR
jgi:hypothetical protein